MTGARQHAETEASRRSGANAEVLNERFVADTERYRRELLAHCYRMVGSVHEAEDLVQETYIRAWRAYPRFEGRSSVRTWLYTIATNACVDTLSDHRRRVLPSGLRGAYRGPDAPPRLDGEAGLSWLQPMPDALIATSVGDPESHVIARESLRLALIASLQHLPVRQRAIVILREALAFTAGETAKILGTTPAAVKTGLQRARARLAELDTTPEDLIEPTDRRARTLLAGYIAAFEHSDVSLLEQVLRADATLEATPFENWYAGREACMRQLEKYVLGAPGDWRMLPTQANGQPAVVTYHRDADGVLVPYGVAVLTPTTTGVSRVVAFKDPTLVAVFGFPETPSRTRSPGGEAEVDSGPSGHRRQVEHGKFHSERG
ncbi:RNA polymerase subunit sigma-70 [Nocardia bhagyanarayanae]|uniref:RNA polymerase sigma factor n=1 Tax=Nocardia bhagyanarayanae TaxID=1215925 RepID=A0A543FBC7_9NOCA|nr:RNA polymerase subunit sigma-70 [Nocardia bhagyanarayanae]TQM31100.1 RNA polymerase ECF family sigma subunit [Nocardia bhagyanarayanae]